MLKGKIFDLEEADIPFVIDDTQRIIVTPPDNLAKWFSSDIVSTKNVRGVLSDGRPIRFFGCKYDGRHFSAQGYVYSHNNLIPDSLESFAIIRFTGQAIDNFSGGVSSAFDRENLEHVVGRMPGITPRPWDSITHRFESEIAGQHCRIEIDNYLSYNLRWGERQIGTCIPRFSISFPDLIDVGYIPEIYLGVYDFFAFLNFRRCITFDSIALYGQNQTGESYKTANVVIFSRHAETRRRDYFSSVTLDDLGNNLGSLFANIASRRGREIFDDIFIPEDESDYSSVSHTSFLSCALSFEGEYDRTQPTKEETNNVFRDVKEIACDAVISSTATITGIPEADVRVLLIDGVERDINARITELANGKSKTKREKIVSYAKKMLIELRRVDFRLEEQFNNALKTYSAIIDPYREMLAARMEIDPQESKNLGQVFSGFRNQIGHGHPKPIERIHAYSFLIGRCLTYIMILKSAGLEDEQVGKILKKLFK